MSMSAGALVQGPMRYRNQWVGSGTTTTTVTDLHVGYEGPIGESVGNMFRAFWPGER